MEAPIFRASKRRKLVKKRPKDESTPVFTETDEEVSASSNLNALALPSRNSSITPENSGTSIGGSHLHAILKIRNQVRRGGIAIEIAATSPRPEHVSELAKLQAPSDEHENIIDKATRRFAPQTGQISATNDKHMMVFIDAEMSKLRHGAITSKDADSRRSNRFDETSDGRRVERSPQRQPAALGKLHEIDLGPDVSLKNIEMTQAAKERLDSGMPALLEESRSNRRLGKDGKPRKNRWRRGSDDVKRDELVDTILKESKLDLYEEPERALQNNDDQAADDRLAEEFRREFMEALEARNNVKKQAPPPIASGKGQKVDDRSKGPKLGGSRSARAQMRAQEEAGKKI